MHRILPVISLIASVFVAVLPCRAQSSRGEIQAGPAIAYEDAFPAQEIFDRPLLVAFHPTDADMAYVVTQPGQVLRVPRDGSKSDRAVFLDITDRVYMGHFEEGLLGFQFDPDYAANDFVYIYWSEKIKKRAGAMAGGKKRKSNRQSVISRFKVERDGDGVTVDLDSELRLMEVFQPFGNHNGGTILFGPDKMLYVALGDGGAANDPYGNGESLEVLLGKVLRIDVRGATKAEPYKTPEDNPFVGQPEARGEIWCYGLRNVWRMSFDRATGDLWAGDVGQGRLEEVVRLVKGGFYGWNSFEGTEKFLLRRSKRETPAGHIPPIAEYPHRDGISITGGHVYRGAKIPGLVGFFVYGDYQTKRMWACQENREGGKHRVVTLASAKFQPSSFAEEPDGELLITCFIGKKGMEGRIFRLVAAGE